MKLNTLPVLALPCALAILTAVPGVFADDYDKKTDVTISAPIEVPGGVVLQPGTYTFKLLNATANRHVVQISSEDGKTNYPLIMTTAARRTSRADKTVLTFYEMPNDSPQALRQWFWPGDLDGQEFLYPHRRAAEISQLTNQQVTEAPEDQPVAENTAPAAPAPETETQAPEAPAPNPLVAQAAPAPVEPETPAPQPDLLAQANPPAPAPDATPAPVQSSSQNSSDDSNLPKTASDLPMIAAAGCLSLAAALTLRRMGRV